MKPPRHLASALPPSVDGSTVERSPPCALAPMATDASTSVPSESESPTSKRRRITSTPESPLVSRPSTWNDRSPSSEPSSPTPSVSPTSPVDSTSNGLGFSRFWRQHLKERYDKCVLPTKTDSVDSHSTFCSKFSESVVRQSAWQTMTKRTPLNKSWQTTSCPSSQFLGLGSMAPEVEPVAPVASIDLNEKGFFKRKIPLKGQLRSYKIRLYPTKEQKMEMKKWFAAARRAYNSAIDMVTKQGHPCNLVKLRKEIAVSNKLKTDWERDVPTTVRVAAIKQATDAIKINLKKGKKFKMKFRSFKRSTQETIQLEKQYPKELAKLRAEVGKDAIHGTSAIHSIMRYHSSGSKKAYAGIRFAEKTKLGKLGYVSMRDSNWLIDKLVEDNGLSENGNLVWDKRSNNFYMIATLDVPKPRDPDPLWQEKRLVSLDPGSKTFQTYYSPDGTHGDLLVGMDAYVHRQNERIADVTRDIQQLKKDKDLPSCVRQRRISHRSKLLKRLRCKIENWRMNVHYGAANFLLREYDVIFLPEFKTSRMVVRSTRNIPKSVVKSLYGLAHYQFKMRLKSKAEMYAGRHVVDIKEPGTSKTCGACGHWNATLGGKRLYDCDNCGIRIDRDVNGARNNLLALII